MRFSRYRDHQPVGGWLQQIPLHWGVSRLRWHTKCYSGGTPDKQRPEFWTDGTIPWLNSGAVNEPVITEPSEMITEAGFTASSAKWIPAGALVMALAGQGKTKGTVAQVAFRTTCNQSMAAIVPGSRLDPRFLYWWLASNYQNIRNMSGGDLRDGLNLELLGDISCPLPPFDEQRSLASFLDRETARIDALVAEQERLILLLREKRQAVISHAVTKGLNPATSLKPSGIEWIGEVPEHWEVGPVKRWFITTSGGTPDTSRRDEYYAQQDGFPWIRTTDLNDAALNSYEIQITDAGMRATVCELLPPDSVLVAMYGGEGTVGKNSRLAFSACINQAICGLLPCEAFDARFTHAFMQFYRPYWMIGAESSRKDPNISQRLIRNSPILRPPLHEQASIAKFLEKASRRLDELAATAQRAIQLLAERRSALISAAVTGQIDVRELERAELA